MKKVPEFAGTIILKEFPKSLGLYKDIDGNSWDINAIIYDYVCACPVNELHPYYTCTTDYTARTSRTCNINIVEQTWKPYKIKVVK